MLRSLFTVTPMLVCSRSPSRGAKPDLFDTLDANGDGLISRDEFAAGMKDPPVSLQVQVRNAWRRAELSVDQAMHSANTSTI